jgi:hypothetical protein
MHTTVSVVRPELRSLEVSAVHSHSADTQAAPLLHESLSWRSRRQNSSVFDLITRGRLGHDVLRVLTRSLSRRLHVVNDVSAVGP